MVGANSGWSMGYGIVSNTPINTNNQQQTTTTTTTQTTNIPVITTNPSLGVGTAYTLISLSDKLPIERRVEVVGAWPNNMNNLSSFRTGSKFIHNYTSDTGSHWVEQNYKFKVLSDVPECQVPIFDIYYGHKFGSGSSDLNGKDNITPSKAVYTQFKNLCNDNFEDFKIGTKTLTSIYVIKINRNYSPFDQLELNLHTLDGITYIAQGPGYTQDTYRGVNIGLGAGITRLIQDDTLNYNLLNKTALTSSYNDINSFLNHRNNTSGDYHYIVSGNLEQGVLNPSNPTVFGISYPKLGTMVLDGDMLDQHCKFITSTGSDWFGDNPRRLFTSISGSGMVQDDESKALGFKLRSKIEKFTEQYFIRVKNQDYNFTNNPTYVTGSEGDIHPDFRTDRRVFYTQVGLYNSNYELLAIGKISRPLQKDFVTEGLLTLKLEY
jgi:hypothetical protein